MSEIGQIIKAVPNKHDIDTFRVTSQIAEECEQKLIAATLQQVAQLVNGAVKCDENNNMVIHTGIKLENNHVMGMGNELFDYFDKA